MSDESKVAREVAEDDFGRFVEEMDLDVDPTGWDDEDKRSFEVAKERMLKAIVDGRLAINEKGEPVLTPDEGEPLTFHEPSGASYMAMDQKKQGHLVGKSIATMADMTRTNPARFSRLGNRDFKLCEAILALFLGG